MAMTGGTEITKLRHPCAQTCSGYRQGFEEGREDLRATLSLLQLELGLLNGWAAFGSQLEDHARQMTDCDLKHYRMGAGGAYAEIATKVRASLQLVEDALAELKEQGKGGDA